MWHGTGSWDSLTDGTRCRWKYDLGAQMFSAADTVREAFRRNDHEGNSRWTRCGLVLSQGSEPIWVCAGSVTQWIGNSTLCALGSFSPLLGVCVVYIMGLSYIFVLCERSVLLDSVCAFSSKQNTATGWRQQQIKSSCSYIATKHLRTNTVYFILLYWEECGKG